MTEYYGITCSNIGVSETTSVRVKKNDDGTYEVRVGVSILGSAQMTDEEMREANYNPFHDDWNDNYVQGKGNSSEEAIEDMKKNIKELCDSLWA